jgi:hypothetical protein
MSGLSNAQKVSAVIMQLNEWEAAGKIDKQQGQALNGTNERTPHHNQ